MPRWPISRRCSSGCGRAKESSMSSTPETRAEGGVRSAESEEITGALPHSAFHIPHSMRAARYYAAGDIRIEAVPTPQPGPGEALVATAACGICTGEIVPWYIGRKAPLTPGHEPAGRIVALGPDTAGWQVGDRVFVHHHVPCGQCAACRRGAPVHCATWRSTKLVPGAMADYFLVPAPNLAAD